MKFRIFSHQKVSHKCEHVKCEKEEQKQQLRALDPPQHLPGTRQLHC